MSSSRGTTRLAHNEYTQWVTAVHTDPLPTQVQIEIGGVCDGDVGPGTFAGHVMSADMTTRPGYWLGHTPYEFRGQRHPFVADVIVTEKVGALPHHWTVSGTVTSGWLKGSSVSGEYVPLGECPIPTPGNIDPENRCYGGTLDITPALL
jgi:hypothetical protein